jgi:HK97 family phage portal protein
MRVGFLQSLFTPAPAQPTEQRSLDSLLAMGWGGGSIAGPSVTPSSALQSATVYACVQVLAGSVAQMPLKVYRRLARGKEVASDHPLYFLLHDRPNPEMSAFVFKEALMLHLLTWGNAYAEIEWGADGYPVALWPLLPDRMAVERDKAGEVIYNYKPDYVRSVPLKAWQVLHIPGLSFDGLVGYSPIHLQMGTLGGERAQNEYGWRFFANGARPGVVLKHPARLTKEAAARLRADWNELYRGADKSHRTAVLEEGMGLETIGIPPEEAQFLQTKQFTKREIAAFYRVPPQFLGDSDTATYASAEQFSRDFVVFSLGEWLKRWEEQIALRLLIGDESRELFLQFVRDALVVTQTSERFAAYATAIQSGILTPNEAREKENMNPLPGGDDLLLPLNMAKAEDGAAVDASGDNSNDNDADEQQAPDDQPDDQRALMVAWLDDVRRRLAARITNDVRQGGAKALRQGGREALSEWGEEHQIDWRHAGEEMLQPLAAVAGAPVVDVGFWVTDAYQAAVRELTQNGN